MIFSLFEKVFGSANSRKIKQFRTIVSNINALEADISKLSDDGLREKTAEFKRKLSAGASINDLTEEAFAVVREASKRVLGMRHFDVQLIGGLALHHGMIAEMRTGEGKTLVSSLPAYLNALTGKGVHIVTVNDYLAKRDAEHMGKIHQFLGLTVGVIHGDLYGIQKKNAYAADLTYGTNNEFGFDYLRDNLAMSADAIMQRDHHFAIIDEVDSILIDEARTPLIISGPADDHSDKCVIANEIIKHISEKEIDLSEENRTVALSETGYDILEEQLKRHGLASQKNDVYLGENTDILHYTHQALKAKFLFKKDRDYIVKEGKVILIDEFTGRMSDGRRYSDGLHQAIEAKEQTDILPENQTLSSVTLQNYFRLYDKLSGMTGTAVTEAKEFEQAFGLHVLQIPTNLPVRRFDEADQLFLSEPEKYNALVSEIKAAQEKGQPVLVGTVSIEKSEDFSRLLQKEKVEHSVLNARYHEQEAHIVAQAGRKGIVTISTNMAGRGTDIQLGGNADFRFEAEVKTDMSEAERENLKQKIIQEVETEKKAVTDAGGLYVIGTERHESRRIDNQLRGRSGRQGDPGRSKFFLSLDDDLLRVFGGDKLKGILKRAGLEEGQAVSDRMVSRAIERAQKKIEEMNYDSRKHLMKFDDILNIRRSNVYEKRRELVKGGANIDYVKDMIEKFSTEITEHFLPSSVMAQPERDVSEFELALKQLCNVDFNLHTFVNSEGTDQTDVKNYLTEKLSSASSETFENWKELRDRIISEVILTTLDKHWRIYLNAMDGLSKNIGYRGYGQKNPASEFKKESDEAFGEFIRVWRFDSLRQLFAVRVQHISPEENITETEANSPPETVDFDQFDYENYPRNAPCPCGSALKFKACHGAADQVNGRVSV